MRLPCLIPFSMNLKNRSSKLSTMFAKFSLLNSKDETFINEIAFNALQVHSKTRGIVNFTKQFDTAKDIQNFSKFITFALLAFF